MFEKDTLQINISLLREVQEVLLAVSGGADSVAMAHAMVHLRRQGVLSCDFVIGHINHTLRGAESDADEMFVKKLGEELGVKVVTESVDVRGYAKACKLSIETAGRQLRLQALGEMAQTHRCDCVATAHHKDDLAETMVHRLMRGTGFRGLCGIRPVLSMGDTKFVRPMLCVRRSEIIRYCQDNAIPWREDTSNRNPGFTRNRIRHQLMPALEAESCEIVNKLHKLSQQSCRFQLFTEKLAQNIVVKGQLNETSNRYSIDRAYLKDAARLIFYEVIREILVILGIGLRPYTREHFDAIRDMVGQDRAKADFPGQIEIAVYNGKVTIEKKSEIPLQPPKSVQLTIGQAVVFGPWEISSRLLNRADVDVEHFVKTKDDCVEWFDADKISGALEIRSRGEGDRFKPIGGTGEKTIARFLQDGQFDAEIKQNAFVITNADKILWLAPVRMSEVFRFTKKTRLFIEIRVSIV